MKNFTTIPPKQKYMTVSEIYHAYGSCAVVAYSCKVEDSRPLGGFVIAVQDNPALGSDIMKEYLGQFLQKYSNKKPIFFMRTEASDRKDEVGTHIKLTYDDGFGETIASCEIDLPETPSEETDSHETPSAAEIEVKVSDKQAVVESIPPEVLANALATSVAKDEQHS